MSTQAEIKSTLTAGMVVDVTNHYINRPDHPCYGTTRRTIARTSRVNITFDRHDPDGYTYDESVPWHKGLERDDDGTVRIFWPEVVPAGPFLTIRPALTLFEVTA